MRMFMQGWSEPVTLRFAQLNWFEVNGGDKPKSAVCKVEVEDPTGQFTLSAVNLEENGVRQPVPYDPPGINQEMIQRT